MNILKKLISFFSLKKNHVKDEIVKTLNSGGQEVRLIFARNQRIRYDIHNIDPCNSISLKVSYKYGDLLIKNEKVKIYFYDDGYVGKTSMDHFFKRIRVKKGLFGFNKNQEFRFSKFGEIKNGAMDVYLQKVTTSWTNNGN